MRNSDSAYDTRTGNAITALIAAIRESGRMVECFVNGNVNVDGDIIDADAFDRMAMAWDGTEDGLEDLGF